MQDQTKELVEVAVEIKHETNAAILITDGVIEGWVPKSQIEGDLVYTVGKTLTIEIPEWLAIAKGLI